MATRIKRYECPEAELAGLLDRIEEELGKDAELDMRDFKRGAFLGFIGGIRMVEVIATVRLDPDGSELTDVKQKPSVSKPPKARKKPAKPADPDEPGLFEGQPGEAPVEEDPAEAVDDERLSELGESISELKSAVTEMSDSREQESSDAIDLSRLRELMDSVEGLKDSVDVMISAQREAELAKEEGRPVLEPSSILPIIHRKTYDSLISWGISPDDATGLIYQALEAGGVRLMTEEELLTAVRRIICRKAQVRGLPVPSDSTVGRVIALVGATGVGKTTTIAKLAAWHTFEQDRKVSLVSLDNYRVAAAEQLRKYCEIIDIELDLVFTPQDYAAALERRHNSDLILVDTAGRSPRNSEQVAELREFFAARRPDEVHLVIAAATNADDLKTTLENFSPLYCDNVIFSKLDETRSIGCIHNLGRLSGLPISYFTTGQNVPEDFEPATNEFICNWFDGD